MKALVKNKPVAGIWMEEVPMPTMGETDVLIKIKRTAICGTDIHIYNWDDWAQAHINLPLVVGHEFVGEVAEVGKVAGNFFKVGDLVSGEGHIACGHCRNCRSGRAHLCRANVSVGVTRNGCFADYLCIPSYQVYAVPSTIPLNQISILDPLGNATHTALTYDLIGEDVLITGAGPQGVMAAAIAKHVGARHVVVTDINPYRLKLAKEMGATMAIDTRQTSLKEVMQTLNMKEGFDVGLEMSGNQHAFNEMIAHMNHAGKIAILGFLPNQTTIDWTQIIFKGITIKGVYGREMYNTWYKMVSMLQSGLNIAPIITHEFSVDDFEAAFQTMKSGESGKVIMTWDK